MIILKMIHLGSYLTVTNLPAEERSPSVFSTRTKTIKNVFIFYRTENAQKSGKFSHVQDVVVGR